MVSASVRAASGDDALAVRRVLDAALLEVPEDLSARIADGAVLVAERDSAVVGALVLDGRRVEAVAVRRRRRGAGVGTALVEAAAARTDGPLTATFRPAVRPFYESLGFAVEGDEGDRLRGRR